MKVYIVWGHNNESYEDYYWWVDSVFASEEAAKKYIQELPALYDKEKPRMDELENENGYRQLTEDERKELEALQDRWYWYAGAQYYYTEEYEVKE